MLAPLWNWRFFVPLSPLGVLVLALALAVHRFIAAEEVDFVLHAASLAAVGLVIFAMVMVLVTSALLRFRLGRSDGGSSEGDRSSAALLELETGQPAATGYVFPMLRAWPLVQIRLQWTAPPEVSVEVEQRDRRQLQEIVSPARRGRHPAIARRFVVSDIFGLSRFGLPRRSAQAVRIKPARSRLSGHVISHVVGGDAISHPDGPAGGDLLDMRRYVHGDPLRRVLWKAYARTRQLLVRTPEQAIMPSPSGVGYFVAGPGDEPSASAARFFVEEGLLGDDFLFGADGCPDPTGDTAEALEQIITSADFRGRGAVDLPRFLDRLDQRRRRSCVLFVPPVAGRWLQRLERLAARLPRALVVLAVDCELDPPARRRLARLLFRQPASASDHRRSRALPQLVRRLRRAGFELRVIHRPTGQLIPVGQLEALGR